MSVTRNSCCDSNAFTTCGPRYPVPPRINTFMTGPFSPLELRLISQSSLRTPDGKTRPGARVADVENLPTIQPRGQRAGDGLDHIALFYPHRVRRLILDLVFPHYFAEP